MSFDPSKGGARPPPLWPPTDTPFCRNAATTVTNPRHSWTVVFRRQPQPVGHAQFEAATHATPFLLGLNLAHSRNHMNTHFKESLCNLVTSCNIDDAVQLLLGWRKDLLNPIVEYDAEEEHNRYMSDEEDYEVSLEEILQSLWESVSADYANAKHEEDVSKALILLNDCELLIRQAHRYLCDIHDELAKNAYSRLRIDALKTTNPSYPFITLTSLNQWALEQYNLSIFEEIGKPENQDSPKVFEQFANALAKGDLDIESAHRFRLTFGLLILAWSKYSDTYMNGNKPNASKIIYAINGISETNRKPTKNDVPGYSKHNEFIIEVIDLGSIKQGSISKTIAKNRKLFFAKAIIKFVDMCSEFSDEHHAPDTEKLAQHLNNLAPTTPNIDAKTIQSELDMVLTFNKNHKA